MANDSGIRYLEGMTVDDKRKPLKKISRDGAKRIHQRFFWGDPCESGHGNWRYTSSGHCPICFKRYSVNKDARIKAENCKMREIDALKDDIALRHALREPYDD